ncbi:MAG: GreA/GreB family elongation factor [Saprospiraceae bacterium]|nr:GreA/GreB family elongation factor [Saprospiraceae bacterium]
MRRKEELYLICLKHIDERIDNVQERLTDIEEARNKAVKSTAGDKFETDRAMMQMKEEELHLQLLQAVGVKHNLQKIKNMPPSARVQLGSLVETSLGIYYLSIGIGKVTLESTIYYCISTQSPIGALLLNRKKGDEVKFRDQLLIVKNLL